MRYSRFRPEDAIAAVALWLYGEASDPTGYAAIPRSTAGGHRYLQDKRGAAAMRLAYAGSHSYTATAANERTRSRGRST
jgi:hypothetical protein